jgi:hypothetical protein
VKGAIGKFLCVSEICSTPVGSKVIELTFDLPKSFFFVEFSDIVLKIYLPFYKPFIFIYPNNQIFPPSTIGFLVKDSRIAISLF